jgi:hypothetical protein
MAISPTARTDVAMWVIVLAMAGLLTASARLPKCRLRRISENGKCAHNNVVPQERRAQNCYRATALLPRNPVCLGLACDKIGEISELVGTDGLERLGHYCIVANPRPKGPGAARAT